MSMNNAFYLPLFQDSSTDIFPYDNITKNYASVFSSKASANSSNERIRFNE